MPVTPAGAPAWARTAEIGHYGGSTEKQNYLNRGSIDALTDVSAAQFCRATADMRAVTLTAPFCVLGFGCIDTPSPAAPIMGGYLDGSEVRQGGGIRMMTGDRLLPYSGAEAPTGFPTASRVGDGAIDIVFSASYTDAYGVAAPFTISHVRPGSAVANAVQRVVAQVTGPQTIRVRVFDASDAAVPNAQVTGLAVW